MCESSEFIWIAWDCIAIDGRLYTWDDGSWRDRNGINRTWYLVNKGVKVGKGAWWQWRDSLWMYEQDRSEEPFACGQAPIHCPTGLLVYKNLDGDSDSDVGAGKQAITACSHLFLGDAIYNKQDVGGKENDEQEVHQQEVVCVDDLLASFSCHRDFDVREIGMLRQTHRNFGSMQSHSEQWRFANCEQCGWHCDWFRHRDCQNLNSWTFSVTEGTLGFQCWYCAYSHTSCLWRYLGWQDYGSDMDVG